MTAHSLTVFNMTMADKDISDNSEMSDTFYALSLPIDTRRAMADSLCDTKLVFNDKKQVLEAVKKWKGSRFKAFDDIKDAIRFSNEAIYPEVDPNDNNNSKNIEKSLSPFSGLHPRELAKLRKAIQSGNYSTVQQMIWSNPRFLVSSGDTPVILMEGPRYNACHIAAKDASAHVLRLILTTVSDKKFMKLLYPFDSDTITESRVNYLLDLYLNTPEKGFNETPLHFGSKFGSIETVSVLLSYPMCDTEKVNRNGQKASQIICERKGDARIKEEIRKRFESRHYVPLIRDDFKAQIGKPYKISTAEPEISGEVAALAGPMSPEQAQKLYDKLKSPLKCTPSQRKIRLTDSRKGLERIARNLCKEMDINFVEYWNFLNTSVDLRSEQGLQLLESHLRNVYYNLDLSSEKGSRLCEKGVNCEDKAVSEDLAERISDLSLNGDNSCLTENDCQTKFQTTDVGSDLFECSIRKQSFESCADDSDSELSFVSACSSPSFLYNFYINGAKISREDIDAALALQHIIHSDRCLSYDFIQNWFHRVYKEERQHFQLSESL